MSYSSEVLADSPILYLRLAETSGTTADNLGSGGATYDGTYVDTPTLNQTPGAVAGNAAILLNGSSEYITVPDGAALDTGDTFTLECWVSRTAENAGEECMISGGSNSYRLQFNNNGVEIAQQAVSIIGFSTVGVSNDGWHHIVWTKSGSTNKIYIDGTDYTGTMTNATISSPGTVYLGASSAGPSNYLNAKLDEVAIYSTALSSTRVSAHYAARNDADVPVWTTPADTVSMSTTPELKFDSPTAAVAQHFYLQLDTANTFDTGNLRTYRSDTSQTNWTYWDGDSWEAMPSTGLPSGMSGNEVRYTVTSALSAATWYRRVRAGTLV